MRTRSWLAIAASCGLALVSAACIIGPKHDDPVSSGSPPPSDAGIDVGFDPFEVGAADAPADASPPPPSDTSSSDTGAPKTDGAGDGEASDAATDAPSDSPTDASDTSDAKEDG